MSKSKGGSGPSNKNEKGPFVEKAPVSPDWAWGVLKLGDEKDRTQKGIGDSFDSLSSSAQKAKDSGLLKDLASARNQAMDYLRRKAEFDERQNEKTPGIFKRIVKNRVFKTVLWAGIISTAISGFFRSGDNKQPSGAKPAVESKSTSTENNLDDIARNIERMENEMNREEGAAKHKEDVPRGIGYRGLVEYFRDAKPDDFGRIIVGFEGSKDKYIITAEDQEELRKIAEKYNERLDKVKGRTGARDESTVSRTRVDMRKYIVKNCHKVGA